MRGPGTTYNYLRKHTLAAAVGALLIAAGVLWSGTLSSNAAGETLGVDASPDGTNTANTLGTIEECREVSVGQTFDVDLYIQNGTDIKAWELYFGFNSALLQLGNPAFNVAFFVPGTPLSEVYPNQLFVGAYTFNQGPGSTGSGVLARITLQAIAPGLSEASIRTTPLAPYLSTTSGAFYHSSPIVNARIAIGQSCSGAPTLPPTPTAPPTLPPTPSPTPTSTPTSAPTPTPSFTPVPGSIPWGDINCANGVTIQDAVYIAMLKSGTSVSPIGSPCPEIGDKVIGAPIAVNWGDFDCSQQFDLGDAIHIIRYLIGLTGGVGGCPLIATNYVSFP